MAKKLQPLNWFPFATDRWLGEIAGGLTAAQKGALSDLLATAYTQVPPCTLPNDDVYLSGKSGLGKDWKRNKAAVLARFEETPDGRLLCGWLRAIYDEQLIKYTNRSSANKENRNGSSTKPDTKDTTNRDTNRRQEGEEALPLQGKKPLTTDDAPAPDGARSAVAEPGHRLTAEAEEALKRRGMRQADLDANAEKIPPVSDAVREAKRFAYDALLGKESAAWVAANKATAREIGREERVALGFPETGELSPVKNMTLRARIEERIRILHHWPTLETWDGGDFSHPGVAA